MTKKLHASKIRVAKKPLTKARLKKIERAIDLLLRKMLPTDADRIAVVETLIREIGDPVTLAYSTPATPAELRLAEKLVEAKTPAEADRVADKIIAKFRGNTRNARRARVERITARATKVFGSPTAANKWMKTPQPALGDKKPRELAKTAAGHAWVLNLLGAIEDGGYL